MQTHRLEAFSDGVVAILITIMVLELRIPHAPTAHALRSLAPVFFTYVLSFVNLGIYWNNHHHMLHATHHVTGGVLWANVHLLFWLSLIPFTTAWMGESGFEPFPTAAYGAVLLFSGIAYYALQSTIIAYDGMAPEVARLLRGDVKGRLSVVLYAAAVPLAFVHRAIAGAIYAAVALMWLVPDRRIERTLKH